MAAWRYIHEVSFFKNQRSFCDFCKNKLKWYDNIPVISFLILKGKSRCCGKKLPLIYPITELILGILFVTGFNLVNYLVFTILIFAARVDLEEMILPDRANLGLVIIAVGLLFFRNDWMTYLISGVGSLLFFFILNRIKIRGSEAMGMGDVKYALFMGLFLGFPKVIVAIYLAFIIGAMVSVVLLLLKKVKRTDPIPFGPFLILGTIVAMYLNFDMLSLFR
jgi:prepilin signal peptidase PulO-like enzyme (type II secretory pathway)